MATVEMTTFLSPYKAVSAVDPNWGGGLRATWPASTSTLITAGSNGVLVDSLLTTAEGDRVADWVLASGADLSTVYVTHAHADHFFGATSLLRRIPTARLVSVPEVAAAAAEQTAPGYVRVWEGRFPGQIPVQPAIPEALTGDELPVGAQVLKTLSVGRSDIEVSTVVHVPDLAAVVSGDVAYNDIHLWLGGSTAGTRSQWRQALDDIEQLAPRTIITGHKSPDASDDDAGRILDQTRQYLTDFDAAAASSSNPSELIAAMMSRHGGRGNCGCPLRASSVPDTAGPTG